MASISSKINEFLHSPKTREMVDKAKAAANKPENRAKIKQVQQKFTNRTHGPGHHNAPGSPRPPAARPPTARPPARPRATRAATARSTVTVSGRPGLAALVPSRATVSGRPAGPMPAMVSGRPAGPVPVTVSGRPAATTRTSLRAPVRPTPAVVPATDRPAVSPRPSWCWPERDVVRHRDPGRTIAP